MKVINKALTLLALTLLANATLTAQASQPAVQTNVYKVVKTNKGQTYLLANSNMGRTVLTEIYFRIGTIYEFDSVSGISLMVSKILSDRIQSDIRSKGKQVKYYPTIEPELVGFHFESDLSDLDYVLALANDKIMQPKFDAESADEAKMSMRADLDSIKHSPAAIDEAAVMARLWQKDYKKLNIYGDQTTYTRITPAELTWFHHKYFLPLNNAICLIGSIDEKDAVNKMQNAFKDFNTVEFNPELISKVIEFKPVVNHVQLLSTNSDRNIATITYQNPGARQDRKGSYCAFILASMINDKEGSFQRMANAQPGIYDLHADYICNNFNGTLKLRVESGGSDFNDMFMKLSNLMAEVTKKNFFKEGEVEKAARNIEIEYNDLRATHLHDYMNMVAKFRFANDENYFLTFTDSLKRTTVSDMTRYVTDYFSDNTGIRCLYTSARAMRNAKPDQQYFPLDESVGDVRFNYELNKTDIEADTAKRDLQRLIQWLKINPDMHVQINGFADESEFKKSFDTTVMHFIDSTPSFRKAMPDAIKVRYLRIEMMRAMKIAKAIYEAGITEDRISGTSMVFTSDTDEKAVENRKCTVTLEKMRPRPSLYEYHFGKKKEEEKTNAR